MTATTGIKIAQYALAGLALATLVAGHVLEWGLPEYLDSLLGGIAGWLLLMRPSDSRSLGGSGGR